MRHQQIFVNLPVEDLPRSKSFYQALGYEINPQFTNNDAACIVMSDHIHAMLLTKPFFQGFTPKTIVDARQGTEVLLCLSCESRAEVEAQINKAQGAGGTLPREPQDHGFMYAHAFEDPDGHIWELVYMDVSQFPGA